MLKHQPIGFLKHSQLQGIFWPLAHANRSSISNSCISSSTKHLFGPPTIHEPGFVRTTRAVHNKHTEAARECSQFEAGTPNVAISGDFSSPPCRPAEVASFARLSTARRVSFTIVAHPITK